MNSEYLDRFIAIAKDEDIKDGDHSTLSCIPVDAVGNAKLLVKQNGIVAGVEIGKYILKSFDPNCQIESFIEDGSEISEGEIVLQVRANVQALLQAERLVLNVIQRMSGIATETARYVNALSEFGTKVLDTRKTTPGFRYFEKEAVRIGGGVNHRMGLYDMVMLKDNHIDFAGGITKAVERTKQYLADNKKDLKIEVEVRNLEHVKEVLNVGGVHRLMLDNFTPKATKEAVEFIDGRIEIESSGGITFETLKDYAACGVDYISVGALTHQVKSLDLSLKAIDY